MVFNMPTQEEQQVTTDHRFRIQWFPPFGLMQTQKDYSESQRIAQTTKARKALPLEILWSTYESRTQPGVILQRPVGIRNHAVRIDRPVSAYSANHAI